MKEKNQRVCVCGYCDFFLPSSVIKKRGRRKKNEEGVMEK